MSESQKIACNKPERKRISSEIITRYNISKKGVPKSKSHRKKISKSNMGKKMTEHFKQLRREYMLKNPISYWKGKKRSKKDRLKMGLPKRGKIGMDSSNRKIIYQYDLCGNKINMFYGCCEASRELGIGRSSIKNNLRGYTKICRKKFIFKYAN